MAKEEIRNGQAEYGTVHVMEEEMRAAGQGVFEAKSGEAGQKNAGTAPANKARKAAPEDKDAAPTVSMHNSKAELVEIAEAEGVTVEDGDTKEDLVRKIEKGRK